MEIQKFNPTKAEIQTAVDAVKDLTIKGVADVAGYDAVKSAKKNLADYRILITKFGKKQREEALAWQREVLRQEKELLAMIEPTESRFKNELELVDLAKKREERKVLLPSRQELLKEIGLVMEDEKLLDMDEDQFSAFFGEKKVAFLEEKDRVRQEKEDEEKRAAEIEAAKKEAAKKAKEQERERQRRLKEREIQKQQIRINKEKEDQARAEKNAKYQEWLKKNGRTEENKDSFLVRREGNTFTIYKKLDEIII